ncbi:DoxX family protein [Actinomadura rudentiformis]|uniref:DoxX family protein n=1 Tax=Actinomadura rudentiformis TaxID=359158 RepID=A0A6H9YR83_9ACTN|nr:DoxX family protein [Actinomadura rudentiformis]KAB2346399.1 DoxX family protein [Actinomadura rudentiformis]
MRPSLFYDVVALLARIAVGVVFIAHGWQKIEAGITATGQSFDDLGVPVPTAAAAYAAFVELLGGAALIAGAGLPIAGALLFLDMAGAFVFVHVDQGLMLVEGDKVGYGYELVLVLGLVSLLFAAGAGGRLSVDALVFKRGAWPQEDPDPDPEVTEALKHFVEVGESPGTPSPAPDEPRAHAPDEPRTAAAIIEGTEDDTLVAGRRGIRRRRPSHTQPVERPEEGPPTP